MEHRLLRKKNIQKILNSALSTYFFPPEFVSELLPDFSRKMSEWIQFSCTNELLWQRGNSKTRFEKPISFLSTIFSQFRRSFFRHHCELGYVGSRQHLSLLLCLLDLLQHYLITFWNFWCDGRMMPIASNFIPKDDQWPSTIGMFIVQLLSGVNVCIHGVLTLPRLNQCY